MAERLREEPHAPPAVRACSHAAAEPARSSRFRHRTSRSTPSRCLNRPSRLQKRRGPNWCETDRARPRRVFQRAEGAAAAAQRWGDGTQRSRHPRQHALAGCRRHLDHRRPVQDQGRGRRCTRHFRRHHAARPHRPSARDGVGHFVPGIRRQSRSFTALAEANAACPSCRCNAPPDAW